MGDVKNSVNYLLCTNFNRLYDSFIQHFTQKVQYTISFNVVNFKVFCIYHPLFNKCVMLIVSKFSQRSLTNNLGSGITFTTISLNLFIHFCLFVMLCFASFEGQKTDLGANIGCSNML